MNEDLHALIQNLQESNADMKSQHNLLSIKLKKQKQRNLQQAAMIKRYRKIIDETSGPHKEKSNTDINQNNSENADSGTIDFKTVTLMKISNLTSSISEHEQDCSVLQNTKLKYITNEPVFASLEPVLKNIMKCSTLYELFYNATIQVKKLIHCKLCTVFVFNNRIVKLSKQEKAKMVQIVHDNKWIDAMSEVDSKIGDPWFTKISDLRNGHKTSDSLSLPILSKKDEILAWLQLTYKNKRGFKEKDIKNSKIDRMIFGIYSTVVQVKMESIISNMKSEEKHSHLFDTLSLASRITTQRSYRSLITEIKLLLPRYFGFDSVGVLLLDTKTNDLFTISDIQITGHEDRKLQEGEEYWQSKEIINFPSNLGISGSVFQKGKISQSSVFICNEANRERKFIPDIDNLSGSAEPENFLIGPIYDNNKKVPVGIIQLVNKLDKRQINQEDVKRFEIIQELLGQSVTNTAEIHELINVTIGLKSSLGNIQNLAHNSVFEPDLSLKPKRPWMNSN